MPNTNQESHLYVIQSKIGNSNWALAVRNNTYPDADIMDWKHEDCSVHLARLTNSDAQLWIKEEDDRGGFLLRAAFLDCQAYPQGIYLRAGGSQASGPVTLVPNDGTDPEFIWNKEGGDGWGCLNKLPDSEQKLQVQGDGPYDESSKICNYEYDRGSDHELWKLIPRISDYTDTVVEYGKTTISPGAPFTAASGVIENTTGATTDVGTSLSTTRTTSYSHSVSHESSTTYSVTQSLGVTFKIKKVMEIEEQTSFTWATTNSTITGDEESVSESTTVTTDVTLSDVKAGKRYEVVIQANKATLTAPYTATLHHKRADGSVGQPFTISGVYTYDGAYQYKTIVFELDANGARLGEVKTAKIKELPPVKVAIDA